MPAAHDVHPEFGLLCPTPRLRRRIRLALTCTVLALIGLAVLRASNHAPSAPRVAALEQDLGGTRLDGGVPPAPTLAARPTLAESTQAGAAKTACAQDSSAHRIWFYLDGKCVAGKARRPRMVRAATDRPALAAITIGTLVAPERTPEPISPPASVPTGRQGDPLKSATATPGDAGPWRSHRLGPQRPRSCIKRRAITTAGVTQPEMVLLGGARCAPATGMRGAMASVSAITGVGDTPVRALMAPSASSGDIARVGAGVFLCSGQSL